MDSLETLAFARSLIDIDSTTGREAEAGQWLAARLAALGYNVLEQKIARGCAKLPLVVNLASALRPGGKDGNSAPASNCACAHDDARV